MSSVYILHGWAVDYQNHLKWQPLLSALAQRQVSAEFLKLPGLSTPLDRAWSLDEYVAWTLEQLPARPVTLVGHSFGGQLALRLAALHPDRVQRLILIDSSGLRDRRLHAELKRRVFWLLAKLGRPIFKAAWARKVLYRLARERDYFNAPLVMRQTMSQVLGQEIRQDLANVKAPTLILWGEQDRVTPLRNAELLHRNLPGSQLVIIPEARHSPQFTHVPQVADQIYTFVTGATS